eukprot:TRINITY_DN6020_c0_g1_i2.p1 TRINITY_DN6020_c0_g1~~TRINITY_DN6020_c0_g1_i2.p1  ORF type:complete len:5426 (+),score=1513.70 TRINITY_DN6020_c0_g1_i2:922-16278(+)
MAQPDLVPTATTTRNLHALALASSQGSPVMLEGPSGSGKTVLVEYLAYITGNHNLIKVHLGDQTDAKTLIGTYIATEVPSEFRWQPGPLTQAVQGGMWILIEDIDLAPHDVQSVLLPLLETRHLFIPGRGEEISAAAGFQLFATRTLSAGGGAMNVAQSGNLLGTLWTRVVVNPLSREELYIVLTTLFPSIAALVPKFIATYSSLVDIARTPSLLYADAGSKGGVNLVRISSSRSFSTRDLFKWIRRVYSLLDGKYTPIPNVPLPSEVAELIFAESLDCFCAMYSRKGISRKLADMIALCWSIVPDRVEYHWNLYKPILQVSETALSVGRITLPVQHTRRTRRGGNGDSSEAVFAYTSHVLRNIECVASCVHRNEPLLLVGETGTGKTATVQHLAELLSQRLIVMNLNQQSESSDLLGGFKPMELRVLCEPLVQTFETIFPKTFSRQANADLLERVRAFYIKQDWLKFIVLLRRIVDLVEKKLVAEQTAEAAVDATPPSAQKRKRTATGKKGDKQQQEKQRSKKKVHALSPVLRAKWRDLAAMLDKFEVQQDQLKNKFAFSFVEGSLVKAVKAGDWLLLDEINLASTETLESLSGLLEGGSLTLSETGSVEPIKRHPNFRIFACMNPPTDVGKKDLPPGIRSRFTEVYVDEVDSPEDLSAIIREYLKNVALHPPVDQLVAFYLEARAQASTTLVDGANQHPHYSLRSLCRALQYTVQCAAQYGFARALLDGISMSFLTQLNLPSYAVMELLIQKHLNTDGKGKAKTKSGQSPVPVYGGGGVQFEQFWLPVGEQTPFASPTYIITPSIKRHLASLARAVVFGKFPVLLQGPTAGGKTSMVEYLAQLTGHKFIRINNHEHTDVQEYFGSYIGTETGKLTFKEGILVEAVRKGYWVVLDELNLAPSDVLEALNRLLDSNRELFIPETQETVTPHPQFMLFATQNPPGLYGGRKVLSRAFRNRFMELHIDEIPESELEVIMQRRCSIPCSFAKKLVMVMKDLQRNRGTSHVFAGKHAFITLRDLFRWAERQALGNENQALEGYFLLAERLRKEEDKKVIQEVIQKIFKVKIDPGRIYTSSPEVDEAQCFLREAEAAATGSELLQQVVWTPSMRRLFTLIGKCITHNEPVLLVGGTGVAKTTCCQIWGAVMKRRLHILNCHQHTETSDFLGGLRPVRAHEALGGQLRAALLEFARAASALLPESADKVHGAMQDQQDMSVVLDDFDTFEKELAALPQYAECAELQAKAKEISALRVKFLSLFEWVDGPLVQAMKNGELLLVDEISLAEDAVLERLNSVLEPARLLVLAEKNASEFEEIRAHANFKIMATMNPGGDYGKKELSPAMRNRFTEIWVPPLSPESDFLQIITGKLTPSLRQFAEPMVKFAVWLTARQANHVLSIRDLLSWMSFMNLCTERSLLCPVAAYINGASMVVLDGLGVGLGMPEAAAQQLRSECMQHLLELLPDAVRQQYAAPEKITVFNDGALLHVGPFATPNGQLPVPPREHYIFEAPTTASNTLRVVRALQQPRAILLEGSPGVGKTSLIEALAIASGHQYTRINLSEQTDISDLLGADLPVEGGKGGEFAWRDGVFLQALKEGHWVLLDELNLASQSVLEGLNSCLDHRSTLYIPELNRTFHCEREFRIFACQNPSHQGGGRKGLPKSFLNRFTQVFIEKLSSADLQIIMSAVYPQMDRALQEKMIAFNEALFTEVMVTGSFGHKGAPWDFNLRDMFRWCDLLTKPVLQQEPGAVGLYAELVYLSRLRTEEDRQQAAALYERVMGMKMNWNSNPYYHITPATVQVGAAWLPRTDTLELLPRKALQLLQHNCHTLQSMMKCVEMDWFVILVGPSAAGKTSLVRLLAQLTGNRLHEFSMNSSVDTTEILGGYEQVDLLRHRKALLALLKDIVHTASVQLFAAGSEDSIAKLRSLQQAWCTFFIPEKFASPQPSRVKAFTPEQGEALSLLLHEIDALVSAQNVNLSQCLLTAVQTEINRIDLIEKGSIAGCFEWLDGLIIKAMELGDWLLIDNVNFCNPTVLDRLNPVLEPHGVLSVNERGLLDGKIKAIAPHRNFRLFFVMNPANGEISRAMRNRGVELFLSEPVIGNRDTVATLNSIGVPGSEIPNSMISFHEAATAQGRQMGDVSLNGRDLLHWAELVVDLGRRGAPPIESLYLGMEQVYIRQCRNHDLVPHTQKLFADQFRRWSDCEYRSHFLEPGVWPLLISGKLYQRDARMATVLRQGAFLFHLLVDLQKVCCSGAPCSFGTSIHETPPESVDHAQLDATYSAQVRTAAHYFVETASPEDCSMRVHCMREWLCDHLRKQQPLVAAEVDSAASALSLLFGHEVCNTVAAQRREIGAVLASPDVMSDQPLVLAENAPLLHFLAVVAQTRGGTCTALLAEHADLLQRVALMRSRLYHVAREDLHMLAGGKNRSKNASPLARALLFHQHKAELRDLNAGWESLLIPFFTTVFTAITEWLLPSKRCDAIGDEVALRLEEAISELHELWDLLAAGSVEAEMFVARWMRAVKLFAGVPELFPPHASAVISKLRALVAECAMPMPLWKHCHPPPMRLSADTAAVLSELMMLCGRLDETEVLNHGGDFGKLSAAVKRTLLEAVSSLAVISTTQAAPTAEEIAQLPKLLRARMLDDTQQSASDDEVDSTLVFPFADFVSVAAEMELLTDLHTGPFNGATFAPRVNTFVSQLLGTTSRNPLDAAGYLQAMWCGSVTGLLCSMSASFHARLWSNSFDRHLVEGTRGPESLFHGVLSLLSLKHLGSYATMGISNWKTAASFTRSLHSLLAYEPHAARDPERDSWLLLLSTCAQTIEAFGRFFPQERWAELRSRLAALYRPRVWPPSEQEAHSLDPASWWQQLSACANAEFSTAFAAVGRPLVEAVCAGARATPGTRESRVALSRAWTCLGLLRLHLLVPPSCDPVALCNAKQQALLSRIAQLNGEIEARRTVEHMFTGAGSNSVVERLEYLRAALTARLDRLKDRVVQRPEPAQYVTLQSDLHRFKATLASPGKVLPLLDDTASAMQDEERRSWQEQALQFVDNIRHRYFLFRDIVDPVADAILLVKFGLCIRPGPQADGRSLALLQECLSLLLEFPSRSPALSRVQRIVEGFTPSLLSSDVTRGCVEPMLKAMLSIVLVQLKSGQMQLAPALSVLLQIFDIYNKEWERRQAVRRAKEEEEAIQLRFRTKQLTLDTTGAEEEAEVEQEIADTFPTFTDDFRDIQDDEEGDNDKPAKPQDATDTEKVLSSQNDEVLAATVCKYHLSLFNFYDVKDSLQDSFSLCYSAAFSLQSSVPSLSLPASADSRTLCAHILKAGIVGGFAAPPVTSDVPNLTNIYKESAPTEASLLVTPMHALVTRTQGLLAEWPDHDVLKQVLLISNRILKFNIESPLMRFLLALELLLTETHKWEEYASKAVSLEDFLLPISQLVARWRKLELLCWKGILAEKKRSISAKSYNWWFHLYSVIRAPPPKTVEECDSTLAQFVNSVDTFVRSSSLGEFEVRLALLKTFCYHLYWLVREEQEQQEQHTIYWRRLAVSLWNVTQFYSQFVPGLQRHVQEQCKEIDKKLDDFVKLAKWDEASYYSLKDRSAKSHRQLVLLSREYSRMLAPSVDQLCSKDAEPVVEPKMDAAGNGLEILQAGLTLADGVEEALARSPFLRLQPLGVAEEQAVAKNLYRVDKYLKRVTAANQAEVRCTGWEPLEALCSEIITRAKDLEEAKADKSSKGRKHLAVVELLKKLAQLGLSHRTAAFAKELVMDRLLQKPAAMDCRSALDKLTFVSFSQAELESQRAWWDKAQTYFYRCLQKLGMLRTAAVLPSKDLSRREVDRSSAYSEHLLYLLAQHRTEMATLVDSLERATSICREMLLGDAATSTPLVPRRQQQLLALLGRLHAHWQLQLQVVSEARALHEVSFRKADVLQQFTELEGRTGSTLAEFRKVHKNHQTLATQETVLLLVQQAEAVENIHAEFVLLVNTFPNDVAQSFNPFSEQVTTLLHDLHDCVGLPSAQQNSAFSGAAFAAQFTTACSDVLAHLLLAVQDMTSEAKKMREAMGASKKEKAAKPAASGDKASEQPASAADEKGVATEAAEEEPEEEDPWDKEGIMTALMGHNTHLLRFAGLEDLTRKVKTALSVLAVSAETLDSATINTAAETLVALHSVVKQFLYRVAMLTDAAMAKQKSMCKFAYVVMSVWHTLYAKGFCTADEEDGEDDQEGDFKDNVDGTGMGSGEGVKDVSEQIESEDQLLGDNKAQEEPDQGKKQKEDKEKGFEMSTDFTGDMEDVDQEEDEEKGEEEEDGEKPEPEETIGEVDQQKAQVIDRKMWEQSDEEEDLEELQKEGMSKTNRDEDNEEMALNPDEGEQEEKQDKDHRRDADDKEKDKGTKRDKTEGEGEESEDEEQGKGDKDKETGEAPKEMPRMQDEVGDFDMPEELDLPPMEEVKEEGEGEGEGEEEGKGEEEEGKEEEAGGEEDSDAPDASKPAPEDSEMAAEEGTDAKEGTLEELPTEEPEQGPSVDETEKAAEAATQGGAEPMEDDAEHETMKTDQPEPQLDGTAMLDEEQREEQEQRDAHEPVAPTAAAYGVRSSGGRSVEDQQQQNDEAEQQQGEAAEGAGGQAGENETGAQESSASADGGVEEQLSRGVPQPRPFRSLGDAMKSWKRNLQVQDDQDKPDAKQKPRKMTANERVMHRYLTEEEDTNKDVELPQALAPAAAQDSAKLPPQGPDEQDKADLKQGGERPEENEKEKIQADATAQPQVDIKGKRFAPESTLQPNQLQPATEPIEEDLTAASTAEDASSVVSLGVMQWNNAHEAPLSADELARLQEKADVLQTECRAEAADLVKAQELWYVFERMTNPLAQELCENLRITLEATQTTQLKGDYRTGKRINMKKVIPYIASQFKKDKIWLRRTRPHKRQYQIVLAIDDSESMRQNRAGGTALQALAMIAGALTRLEVGELAVVRFGSEPELVHAFSSVFADTDGARTVSQFKFAQKNTNMTALLSAVVQLLEKVRQASSGSSLVQFLQIVFIISDGRFGERESLKRWILEAQGRGILVVFIIVDNPAPNSTILDVQTITYPQGKLTVTPYMETFPFPYYIILRSIENLPETLANALRQWFELLKNAGAN